MTKPKNVTRINSQDFPVEFRPAIDQLGGILNEHMQDIFDILDGRVDESNLTSGNLQFEITVGATGAPIQQFQLKTGIIQPTGFQVIRAVNIDNILNIATGQPFISYDNTGNDVVTINNVSNLTSGDKYRLTVLVY